MAAAMTTAMAMPLAAQEADAEKGQALFASYCAQCHGADAKGGGPMAEMLAIETPDLTVLSRSNDGIFPTFVVATKIDGRAGVLAHGGDMPIFGPFLESDQNIAIALPNGQPMMTGLPLANVLVYLESIQAE
jgi:mono/diheme cytochrome c family protein